MLSGRIVFLLLLLTSVSIGILTKVKTQGKRTFYEESEFRNASESISISENEDFVLDIVGDVTGGYIWMVEGEHEHLKVNNPNFVHNQHSPSYLVFLITPLSQGEDIIIFHYRRSWETHFAYEYQLIVAIQ